MSLSFCCCFRYSCCFSLCSTAICCGGSCGHIPALGLGNIEGTPFPRCTSTWGCLWSCWGGYLSRWIHYFKTLRLQVPYDVTLQQTSLLTILYLERLLNECSLGFTSAVPQNDWKRPQKLSVINSAFRGQESKPGSTRYVAGVFNHWIAELSLRIWTYILSRFMTLK
jgi:hypothetical protein